MSYCMSIEDVADVTRFRNMLSRDPKILGFVKKNDGTWISSRKETLAVQWSTHFPNCVDPESYPLGVADPFCDTDMMSVLEDISTRDKVKSVISSFQPFKSPDPDSTLPALLQHAGDILHEYLVNVYSDCLRRYDITDG